MAIITLKPDSPGAVDLLGHKTSAAMLYYKVYRETKGEPQDKHKAAWKAAVTMKEHEHGAGCNQLS